MLNFTHIIESVPPLDLKFYTSNRYALTGSRVVFENLNTTSVVISSLTVNFGDKGNVVTLTGDNVFNNLYRTYNSAGPKTLTITARTSYNTRPFVLTLPDIIDVVDQYDVVQPGSYIARDTPLVMPYTDIKIAANEWAVADTFNACIQKFYRNIEYLDSRSFVYNSGPSDYYGWLGTNAKQGNRPDNIKPCPSYTWADIDCNINPETNITWVDAATSETNIGDFSSCGIWQKQNCSSAVISPNCFGLYEVNWRWKSRKCIRSENPITWKQTRCTGIFAKRWYFEPSVIAPVVSICDRGVWNVNIPNINDYYDPISVCTFDPVCKYTGVVSRDNILYTTISNQIQILSSNHDATFVAYRSSLDDVTTFIDVKNICIDTSGRLIILDKLLSQVSIYTVVDNDFELFINWGGIGTGISRDRFFNPNDIHVDQYDNIWVTDTGNNSIKAYSNTGTWLRTIQDENFNSGSPLSVCVDSQNRIHVLTENEIRVYTNLGEYLFSYEYKEKVTGTGVRINTSYNREIIYLCTDTQVIKFFRNGIFNGYIIKSQQCIDGITSISQDEFRNLLITSNDKILKYPDLMSLVPLKGDLPGTFWNIEDLYIHPEEYIQNWVYTKSLQRLWDNIETFRSAVLYSNDINICKTYRSPTYSKDQIGVGINEIVTSTVINRNLNYLTENLSTVISVFDPDCLQVEVIQAIQPPQPFVGFTPGELIFSTPVIQPAPPPFIPPGPTFPNDTQPPDQPVNQIGLPLPALDLGVPLSFQPFTILPTTDNSPTPPDTRIVERGMCRNVFLYSYNLTKKEYKDQEVQNIKGNNEVIGDITSHYSFLKTSEGSEFLNNTRKVNNLDNIVHTLVVEVDWKAPYYKYTNKSNQHKYHSRKGGEENSTGIVRSVQYRT